MYVTREIEFINSFRSGAEGGGGGGGGGGTKGGGGGGGGGGGAWRTTNVGDGE